MADMRRAQIPWKRDQQEKHEEPRYHGRETSREKMSSDTLEERPAGKNVRKAQIPWKRDQQ